MTRLRPFIKETKDGFLVGTEDPDGRYSPPVARVYMERGWLYVVTDDYEGCAMLDAEALPKLRLALQKLESRMKHPEGMRP